VCKTTATVPTLGETPERYPGRAEEVAELRPPRSFANTRIKIPEGAVRSFSTADAGSPVEAGEIGGAAFSVTDSVPTCSTGLMKTSRRSTSWQSEHMKV